MNKYSFYGLLHNLMIVCGLMLLTSQPQAETSAPIGVLPDIQADYRKFLGNRSPSTVDYYGGPHARRDVIDLILMQQALALGGFTKPLEFFAEENYFRSIRNVLDGKTLTISGTIWYQDLEGQQDKVHITPPLVLDGQFNVGFYTSADNLKAQSSKNLAQLTQLKVVTSSQWKPDLITLESMGFNKIMYTPNWVNMARMINAKRVDLTLSPFAMNPEQELMVDGIRLLPIKGVRVAIRGSRHWPVSKTHPLGEEFYQALSK